MRSVRGPWQNLVEKRGAVPQKQFKVANTHSSSDTENKRGEPGIKVAGFPVPVITACDSFPCNSHSTVIDVSLKLHVRALFAWGVPRSWGSRE